MAEIHNILDLKAIHLLETELLDVRNELRQCDGYDPACSLAENARFFILAARALAELHQNLRNQYRELKKEQENDKNVARTYPLTRGSGIFTIAVPQEGTFHPENLLGSSDGYGR